MADVLKNDGNDTRSRVDRLEYDVAQIKQALMGDLKNPGSGTLQLVANMHADMVETKKVLEMIKSVLETLRLERAKLLGWISGAVAVGVFTGKYLLK